MKQIFLFIILFFGASLTYAQQNTTEQEFVKELTDAYNKQKDKLLMQSDSIMKQGGVTRDFDYIIYTYINNKSDKELYKNIDSTNLIKYLDINSLGYWGAFVIEKDTLKGMIRMSQKNVFVFSPFLFPKKRNLYQLLKDIRPDILFIALSFPGDFFIKDGAIYGIMLDNKLENCKIYSIDEFVSKYKDDIFFMFNGRSEMLD